MSPGLNSRETALVVSVAALLAFVLTKADVRTSVRSLLRVIFGSAFLSGLIASAVAYAVGTVLLLRYFGYWDTSMVKTAVLWFIGTGIVGVFNTKRVDKWRRAGVRRATQAMHERHTNDT